MRLENDCESEVSFQILILNGNVILIHKNVQKMTNDLKYEKTYEKQTDLKEKSELVKNNGLYMCLKPVIQTEKVNSIRNWTIKMNLNTNWRSENGYELWVQIESEMLIWIWKLNKLFRNDYEFYSGKLIFFPWTKIEPEVKTSV